MKNDGRMRSIGGYTLVEVAVAAGILALTVASSILAMRVGFSMIESARDNTLASQILQSEMENLRLKSWGQLEDLSNGSFQIEEAFIGTTADRFLCERVLNEVRPGLMEVILRVEWKSGDGRTVTREYSSYFSEGGLNDYYYRTF